MAPAPMFRAAQKIEDLIIQYRAGLLTLHEFTFQIHEIYESLPPIRSGDTDPLTGFKHP